VIFAPFGRPARAAVASTLLAAVFGCHDTEYLGLARLDCDAGACLGPDVIAPNATFDITGAAELTRIATLLRGEFVGRLVGLGVIAGDSSLTLSFEPEADPLSGHFRVRCSDAGCGPLSLDLSGTYYLTGLGPSRYAKGYLVVDGEAFTPATEIIGLSVDARGEALAMTLGDITQLWIGIVAQRAAADGGV
jgi:hypothetical protein